MPSDSFGPVKHDVAARRFEIATPGASSILEYNLIGKVADFQHTEVPPGFRGHGLAERLVRAGLDWAEKEGLKVEPSCGYVATFLSRHPEFEHLRRR